MLLDEYLNKREEQESDILLANMDLDEFSDAEKYIKYFIDKDGENFKYSFKSDPIRKPRLDFDVICYLNENAELRVKFELKYDNKRYIFLDTDIRDSISDSRRDYGEIFKYLSIMNSLGYDEKDIIEAISIASMELNHALLNKACGFEEEFTFL